MADQGRDHTTYTWDPVSAAWVHERGPEIPPPPLPPDVHALQSYFFDGESKEWIRTVLAPMGRELAARWQGAHKIPEDSAHRPASKNAKNAKGDKAKKGSSTVGIMVIVVVLVVLLGGVGVVASQSGMLPAGTTPKPTVAVDYTTPAVPTVAASAPASAAATVAPTEAPPVATAPVVVPTVAPPPPVVNLPAGPRATLPDGTVVVYTGPLTATRGGFLPASFTVVLANGRPASGELTIVLGDLAKDPRLVSGLLNANGKIALDVPATLAVGQYPLSVVFKGSRAFLATITLR